MASVGDRVKYARERLKMSQAELARIAGVKQPTIAALEGPKSDGSKWVVQIARALRVRPEWLAMGEDPMQAGNQPRVPSAESLTSVLEAAILAALTDNMRPAEWPQYLGQVLHTALSQSLHEQTTMHSLAHQAQADSRQDA